jgi:hypothetical protein
VAKISIYDHRSLRKKSFSPLELRSSDSTAEKLLPAKRREVLGAWLPGAFEHSSRELLIFGSG